MQRFKHYLKYYILCFILICCILLIIIKFFEVNEDKFIIEVEADIDNIDLGDAKYLWELNLEDLKTQILSLKDIKKVDLRVILPNKVHITMQKRQPIAVWWNYEKFFLVDEDGVIMSETVSDKDKKQYILLVGIDAVYNVKKLMHALLISGYNGKVLSMRFVSKRRWDIVLNDGTLVQLPEIDQESALRLLDRLLRDKSGLALKGDIVDMRLAPKKVFLKR
jgi:cell division septal protein FtsQ